MTIPTVGFIAGQLEAAFGANWLAQAGLGAPPPVPNPDRTQGA